MLRKLEPGGELWDAAVRFRRTLFGREQVVIVTSGSPSVDSMLCAAAMELHLNDLDSRLGIVRIQDDHEKWYDQRYDGAMVILINTQLSSDFLYLLAMNNPVMVIDAKASVTSLVTDHNAKYNKHGDRVVQVGMPIKGYCAAYIGWALSNRYVGNSESAIVVPRILNLMNAYSAALYDAPSKPRDDGDFPSTVFEYMETLYNGSLDQTTELLGASEEAIRAITEGYESLTKAKSLLAMKITRRLISTVAIDGYHIRLMRGNVPRELMDVVGVSIRIPESYLLLYEMVGHALYARVYYGDNWQNKLAANPEVDRLRVNLGGEKEEYGFSFTVPLAKAGFFKSTSDVVVKSLLQNKK